MSKVGTLSKVSKHFYKDERNAVITSDVWDRDSTYPKEFLPHVGYDYRARTPLGIVAPCDGVIVNAVSGLGSTYGRQVFLYDPVQDVTHHSAHHSNVLVVTGDKVVKGQLLAYTGRSGVTETQYAAHLHYGIAKGKITNAGNKGKHLGDIWLDVEEFDFEYKPRLSDKEIAYEIVFGKNIWGDGEARKKALGNRWRSVQDEIEKMLGNKPKPQKPQPPKTDVGRTAQLRGRVKLYNDKFKAYLIPSGKNRDLTILAEKNGFIQVSSSAFKPNKVWIKKTDVRVV